MPRVVESTAEAIADAARRLREGGVVAFPTETVYGLGADLFRTDAIDAVYQLKGRPLDNPLIAHVADAAQASDLVTVWGERAGRLASQFWPGPLTLVLPKAAHVPDAATAGRPTIAVRCPAHEVARRLLDAFEGVIVAPSANRSGHVSPTSAEHVAAEFADCADLVILEGGACERGIESTVLELSEDTPRILRPGTVTRGEIESIIGPVQHAEIQEQAASPGTALSHYAPRTPAELVDPDQLDARLSMADAPAAVLCFDPARIVAPHRGLIMPAHADDYARMLYGRLREADELGLARIVIERPPHDGGLWVAIHDRLRRATHR